MQLLQCTKDSRFDRYTSEIFVDNYETLVSHWRQHVSHSCALFQRHFLFAVANDVVDVVAVVVYVVIRAAVVALKIIAIVVAVAVVAGRDFQRL